MSKSGLDILVAFLGAIVGYFSTFENFLTFWGKLPEKFKLGERWLLLIYAIPFVLSLIFLCFYYLKQLRDEFAKERAQKDSSPRSLVDYYNKIRLIKAFLTLGLSKVADYFLNKAGVISYDYFKKPEHWGDFPSDHDEKMIYRILMSDGIAYEIRYLKGKQGRIVVRKTNKNDIHYGEFQEENVWDYKFLFWITPFYFAKKC